MPGGVGKPKQAVTKITFGERDLRAQLWRSPTTKIIFRNSPTGHGSPEEQLRLPSANPILGDPPTGEDGGPRFGDKGVLPDGPHN